MFGTLTQLLQQYNLFTKKTVFRDVAEQISYNVIKWTFGPNTYSFFFFSPPFTGLKHSDLISTMRVTLLLTLLFLCHGKKYKPINIMELMKIHDIMQQDSGSDEDDDDDDDDNDIGDNFIIDCPFGCQCFRRVVQCSDLGNTCFFV